MRREDEPRREDAAQIKAALQGFAETWLAGRLDEMMGYWDSEGGGELTYVCVDKDELILGLEAIRTYFYGVAGAGYSVLGAEMTEPTVRFLGDELAYAMCHYTWHCQFGPLKFSTKTRATFVLRRRGDRWCYQQLHESVRWGGPVA
jgi:ketosteroid isomerase-like protein